MPKTKLEIPEDLIEAIELSSFERQLPEQGIKAIHRFLIDSSDEKAAKESEEWIEKQKALWQKVDEAVIRCHEVAPVVSVPEWLSEEWWITLCLPWSEQLEEAIKSAHAWCDKKHEQSS